MIFKENWRNLYPSKEPICNWCKSLRKDNYCKIAKNYKGSTARPCILFKFAQLESEEVIDNG